MELIGLMCVLIGLWLLFGPIIAIAKSGRANGRLDALEARVRELERLLKEQRDNAAPQPFAAQVVIPVATPPVTMEPILETPPTRVETAPPPLIPPPLSPAPAIIVANKIEPEAAVLPPVISKPTSTPPPLPTFVPAPPSPPRPAPVAKTSSPVSFEQFMGVKLFAWVGGLALFLGIVFFVKYAFENNLIPKEVRIAIGFVTGMGLLGGGLWVHRRKAYEVMAQTLCATGVLVLYGVTFAAHALYHFAVFNAGVTFAVMVLITAVAFLLSVRMNAQVVAVLGMVGGFLTPILCSTGQDNPVGLFTYIALLDIGLIAVAKHKRWLHLTALGAGGTILMQFGWMDHFGYSGHYYEGSNTWILVAVFAGFAALFAVATRWSNARDDEDLYPAVSALALCGSALLAAFFLLDYHSVMVRPMVLYTFVMLINVAALYVTWVEKRLRLAPAIFGGLTFVHLLYWTCESLTTEMLPAALGIYLVFGLLHTAFGVLWQRRHPALTATAANWIPVIVLVLGLVPLFVLDNLSLWLWPALLVTNGLVIGLAFLTRRLLPVFAAVVLTLMGAALWLLKLPVVSDSSLPEFLVVVGGFAIVFIAAGCYLARRVAPLQALAGVNPMVSTLPVMSAVLPFGLLIMATLRLPVTNPAPVFGLALLLSLFLLGLARIASIHVLSLVALLCTLGAEHAWHSSHFDTATPLQPLLWYLGFYALFSAFPFVFRRAFANATFPWITSAVAGLGSFDLVHQVIARAWPNQVMGLLPAAFAVPALLALFSILKQHRADNSARVSQLAWFGGVALFFITLIFPIQFDRQWITIGWAMEGAALLWLLRRVPHRGLLGTGVGLLIAAFVRLAVNPAVLEYAHRTGTPVWNWYLYAYGLVALAQFMGARWLASPNDHLGGINVRGLLLSFGGVLLFLLMNIEIADAFTPDGYSFVAFQFEGNLARDMTYSIGWGLFSLALLVLGFRQHNKPTRYVGIGLLVITLLKLFFHDLSTIDSIYRIGALMVVAIIALAASFLYQRFLNSNSDRS